MSSIESKKPQLFSNITSPMVELQQTEETTPTPPSTTSATFQEHQETRVDIALAESKHQGPAPSNLASRQLLQGALLQSNFHRAQSENHVSWEGMTVEQVQGKVTENPELLAQFSSFPQAAKEDRSLLLQFFTGNYRTELSWENIPAFLQEDAEVMQGFWQHKKASLEEKANLFHEEVLGEKQEKILPRTQFERSIVRYISRKVDGKLEGSDDLRQGRRDGVVSQTEVFAKLREVLGREEVTRASIEELQQLDTVLTGLEERGISMPVVNAGSNESVDSPVFTEERLQGLQELLERKITRGNRREATKKIQLANENSEVHQSIPDPLEMAVFGYTTSHYSGLNKALRSGNISADEQLYIDGISEGLRQMPSHSGIVWRAADLPDEILAQYEPGEEIVEKAFTSTSYGTKAFFSEPVLYCIQLKEEDSAGKKIENLSEFPEEKEVLINAGTRFRVLAREEEQFAKRKPKTIIYLQEL